MGMQVKSTENNLMINKVVRGLVRNKVKVEERNQY